jgi:pyridinium-3,5-biscarboxylic acid mononucleotide synthase
MSSERINQLFEEFRERRITAIELSEKILQATIRSGEMLTPDLDRQRRCGYAEVVYAEGKPIDRLIEVIDRLLENESASDSEILATRVSVEQARSIGDQFAHVRWNSRARTVRVGKKQQPHAHSETVGKNGSTFVAVVSAGTTDASAAEEACETLAWMTIPSKLIQDVGVAGPYRLLAHLDVLRQASAIVVVAGMEGALPSVVAGHVGVPIIAVPTSVGYGANFGGLSALLTMLNSCASNVTVVNIDSGFRGGYVAGLIAAKQG